MMHLHAVRIFRIATIVGTEGWLDIGHLPRFWPQHAQNRRWIHRAGADFFAVGLPDQTAVGGPIFVQPPDYFLHGGRVRHKMLSSKI